MALMTPVSGRVKPSNSPIMFSKVVRCVIQGPVLIVPSSIYEMIRPKSRGRALRLALVVISGL